MNPHDRSKVVFESDEFHHSAHSFQARTPRMIQWTIGHSGGLIKNVRQAQFVLIGFVVLAVIVSFSLAFGGRGSELTTEELKFQNTPSEAI